MLRKEFIIIATVIRIFAYLYAVKNENTFADKALGFYFFLFLLTNYVVIIIGIIRATFQRSYIYILTIQIVKFYSTQVLHNYDRVLIVSVHDHTRKTIDFIFAAHIHPRRIQRT